MAKPDAADPSGNVAEMRPRQRRSFKIICVLFVFAAAEFAGWVLLATTYKEVEIVRRLLCGADDAAQIVHAENATGQAYLLYIPSPGFEKYGVEQHNEHGYRGTAVPIEKKSGAMRVLFLGGSTTYGYSVKTPNETYPAQVGELLSSKEISCATPVEIINGGVLRATTAELLTHFHFKWRYYRPDVVVINTGGNDASTVLSNYHPDYSHCRYPLPTIEPLPPHAQWLMHSRFVSFISIKLFYSHLTQGTGFFNMRGRTPPADWYPRPDLSPERHPVVSDDNLAFKNNLGTLIREIEHTGAAVMLVSFRASPWNNFPAYWVKEIVRNEEILKTTAQEYGLTIAPFPAETISPENWTDTFCHVNAAGCREKAMHVGKYLADVINQIAAKPQTSERPK